MRVYGLFYTDTNNRQLILQKTVLKKEAELASKKSKLIVLQQQLQQSKGDEKREAKSDGVGGVAAPISDANPSQKKMKRPRSDSAGSTEAKKPRKKLSAKAVASAMPLSLTSSVTSGSLTASDPVVKVESDKPSAKPGKSRKPRSKKK